VAGLAGDAVGELEALAALRGRRVVGVAIEAQLRFVRRLPQARFFAMRCERSSNSTGKARLACLSTRDQ